MQALKPFICKAKLNISKFQGSDVYLWRQLVQLFKTLVLNVQTAIPFHIVRPIVEESAVQMKVSCKQQNDSAEFYSQLIILCSP